MSRQVLSRRDLVRQAEERAEEQLRAIDEVIARAEVAAQSAGPRPKRPGDSEPLGAGDEIAEEVAAPAAEPASGLGTPAAASAQPVPPNGPTVASQTPDTYLDRLVKYVPAEVVALYITCEAILKAAGDANITAYWIVFWLGVVVTPLYLWRVMKVLKWSQHAISTLAFAVWAISIGGPLVEDIPSFIEWYQPVYGALLLPVYTFLIPIAEA